MALSFGNQHAICPEFKMGNEYLNTSFPVPTLLCSVHLQRDVPKIYH